MKNKIVRAKKKKEAKKQGGQLMSMGGGIGNRVAGKIITPAGEVAKMKI